MEFFEEFVKFFFIFSEIKFIVALIIVIFLCFFIKLQQRKILGRSLAVIDMGGSL